jgi:hypothetical protein
MTKKTRYLGQLNTHIAADVLPNPPLQPGQSILWKREPATTLEENAICVQTEAIAELGFLPRYITFWLAPLLDEGKIAMQGKIAPTIKLADVAATGKIPITLHIFMTEAGADILAPNRNPENGRDTSHEIIRRVYDQLLDFYSSEKVLDVWNELMKFADNRIKPESHLLLALFPNRARDLNLSPHTMRQSLNEPERAGTSGGHGSPYLDKVPVIAA